MMQLCPHCCYIPLSILLPDNLSLFGSLYGGEISLHSNIKQQTKLYLRSSNRNMTNMTHHLGKSRDRYSSFAHDIFLSRPMQYIVSGQNEDFGVTSGDFAASTMVFS